MSQIVTPSSIDPSEEAAAAPAPGVGAMGNRAATGFAMMMAQSLVSRVVSFVGQIVLSWLLLPEHFGLMALAGTVVLAAGVVQQLGVREALLARQRDFDELARPAFWLSTLTGVAAGIVIAGAAPLAARLYGDPQLVGLVLVLALSTPLASMAVVPEAELQHRLRFRFLATVAGGTAVGTTALTILFALLGLGAYAFVLPRAVVAAARLAMLWRASGLRPGWSPGVGRWPLLVADSLMIFLSGLFLMSTQVGDVAVLGMLLSPADVGFYSFALNLSLQTIVTISTSMSSVMLPTLSKLRDEPTRQLEAFRRTSAVLGAVLAPICAVQTIGADAAVHAVFGSKWNGAIDAVRVLGVGMLVVGTFIPAYSLMLSQRRLKTVLWMSVLNAAVFFALVPLGARLDGVRGVAVAVSAYLVLNSPMWGVAAVRPLGGGVADTLALALRPAALAAVAGAAGYGAVSLLGGGSGSSGAWSSRAYELLRLGVMGVVVLAAYVPLARWLMPEVWADVRDKVAVLGRRLGLVPA